jgi:hypothetical protein
METAADLKLSPSEKGTLQKIAEGEYHLREFDWVALQHLKKLALAEDRPSASRSPRRAEECFAVLPCPANGVSR